MTEADVRHSLDGEWDFQIDRAGKYSATSVPAWRRAQVPMPWQAQFDDLRNTDGMAWYRKTFTLDREVDPSVVAVILHFGAVDYFATVWLNGTLIGEHEGGYLPFEFDVAATLRAGNNELVVRVIDANSDVEQCTDWPFNEVPHGKQSWYGPIGGIWQSVWLEFRPQLHISAVRLTPIPATGAIEIAARLSLAASSYTELTATVYDPDGQVVATALLDGEGKGVAYLETKPRLWSPDTPQLYTVVTMLEVAGAELHTLRNTCGFRTIEARAGRIYLNGEPIYLRGALDQAYYPGTIYTPPDLAYLEDQARKAKALGLNCLRIHIKVEDPRYYEVADRLGLLIWTEIPNWNLLTAAAMRRGAETLRGMIERDWNHPSIFAWTLINENWGTDLTRNPAHRRWLAEFYQQAKALDPTRLIVDNSACRGNFHVAGDLEDFHYYYAIPDHAAEWDAWVADLASRANDWVWADDHLQHRRADLPLVVSEFGNWGLPDPDAILENGRDPWWFETGYEWGDGVVYPHGVRERFVYYGLDKVFGRLDDFVLTHQQHMALSLHYEISTMRLHADIAGYIITEFTDVHWECNGLLTMQRAVKHGLDPILTSINQDQVVVIRPQQWSGRPGDQLAVELRAFGIDGERDAGSIEWCAGDASGRLAAPGGTVLVPLAAPGMLTLQATWVSAAGAKIARNQIELACAATSAIDHPLYIFDDPELESILKPLGYTLFQGTPDAAIAHGALFVAHHYTKTLRDAVQQGARLLLIADSDFSASDDSTRFPIGHVVLREDTPWEGDWATAFSWLRKQGPFAGLPGSPLLELEYATLMPDAVILGLPAWFTRDHSWAGMAIGWIQKPASLLVEIPYGEGQMVLTTFKLTAQAIAGNPLAQTIWNGALTLLATKAHAQQVGDVAELHAQPM